MDPGEGGGVGGVQGGKYSTVLFISHLKEDFLGLLDLIIWIINFFYDADMGR